MQSLNFPKIELKCRCVDKHVEVFDRLRKRFVRFTPEEWVRQHCIDFLLKTCKIPQSLMQVESSFRLGKLSKRLDILVYNLQYTPLLLVECKQPSVPITQDVFDQIVRYNQSINAPYMLVTNGLQHYCFQLPNGSTSYIFLDSIPHWDELIAVK